MVIILNKEAPILRQKAKAVKNSQFGSPELISIINDMKEALSREEDGVAIAAPQIGVPLRIFVVSGKVFSIGNEIEKSKEPMGIKENVVKKENKKKSFSDKVFINPEIVRKSNDSVLLEEGCLSVRYLYGHVSRAKKVRVRARDEFGKIFERGSSGLLAQIFEHETDHLNGILFIDKTKDLIEILPDGHDSKR